MAVASPKAVKEGLCFYVPDLDGRSRSRFTKQTPLHGITWTSPVAKKDVSRILGLMDVVQLKLKGKYLNISQ